MVLWGLVSLVVWEFVILPDWGLWGLHILPDWRMVLLWLWIVEFWGLIILPDRRLFLLWLVYDLDVASSLSLDVVIGIFVW